ncbi:MAG: AraC family transcriptional regulator [Planctomycetota bacterium]
MSSPEASTDYVESVNRAIDHIVRHLDRPLRLDELADVALFSPYHFHRVFQSLIGETVGQFVKRVRLERALYLMTHNPDQNLTDVALACGFASSSDFSRSFKQRYGVPPSAFDLDAWRSSQRGQLDELVGTDGTSYRLDRLDPGENPDGFEVALRKLPPRTVAYIRVLDPYQGTGVVDAAKRLMSWADEHGVGDRQWLGYMWEDPTIVDLSNCRYDVAVEVDEVRPEAEIGRFEFPAMTVAQVEIRGDIQKEQRAIDWVFGTWLPQSEYVPDDQPAFEAWIGRPFAHGFEHFELFMQLPVRKARSRPK